ncbi:flagellin N-terminal helical domain-containing protein [Oceanirhabdus sp. W0125-5]|uniref:flagellin N-terminal helical domain-containing protein n=1 Tax=Oceanirhabdus sp. W0125-5 TaxID=2999116 RepID=UPI0022F2C0B7|nr:flagellin [Oceanirhabdus sp. W0125-5]WBW95442.1 flagellin [Oceanirhabdus sp. W0125-5]
MRLNKNLATMNAYRNYLRALDIQAGSMEKISSGSKINKAKDNPNKLAQSERLRLQIRSLEMASRNTQDAVSMIQTAEGTMNSITESIQRMRQLVVQSGGALNGNDKDVIDNEITEILNGIQSMAEKNNFNGVNLIGDQTVADNDNPKEIKVTVGGNVGEMVSIEVYNASSKGLGLMDAGGNSLIDLANIDDCLSKVDTALDTVLAIRSKYGAKQNKFESMYNNLIEIRDRNISCESSIRDVNIAEESMQLAKGSLLIDAGNAVMAQTNKFPQEILRVLESVRGR